MAKQRYVKVIITIDGGGSITVDKLDIFFDALKTHFDEKTLKNKLTLKS